MSFDIPATYCRWAEAKYNLTDVIEVKFEPDQHGPYSDVTPDVDAYMGVDVRLADGTRRSFEESYDTDLITDILRFASEQGSRP